jgi:hypothetical protein
MSDDTTVITTVLRAGPLCTACLARKTGVSDDRVPTALTALGASGQLVVGPGRCQACLDALATTYQLIPDDATRRYLQDIAAFVEACAPTRKSAFSARYVVVATPMEAVTHAVNDVPAEQRRDVWHVLRALPLIGATDFAEVARQIRRAAGAPR